MRLRVLRAVFLAAALGSGAACLSIEYGPAVDAGAADASSCGPGVDLTSDPLNCGRCGLACATPRGTLRNPCVGSVCVPACATTFGDCDGVPSNGCEADLRTDDHCARCDVVCNRGLTCLPPAPPHMDDPLHCVACGDVGLPCCGPAQGCLAGLRCDAHFCAR